MSSEKMTTPNIGPSSNTPVGRQPSSAPSSTVPWRGRGRGHPSRMGPWRGSHQQLNPVTPSRAPGRTEQASVGQTEGAMQAPAPYAQPPMSVTVVRPLRSPSQVGPAHSGILNPLQLAREIGHLEKVLEETTTRATYAEGQAGRLRAERDDARRQLEALRIKLDEASGKIMSLERQLQQALSSPGLPPALPYRGPNIPMPVPQNFSGMPTYDIAPPPRSIPQQQGQIYHPPMSSQMTPAPQLTRNLHRTSMAIQRGPQMVAPSTPAAQIVPLAQTMPIAAAGSIKAALSTLFNDAENWADKHATIPVTDNPQAPMLPPDLREMVNHANRIWNDRSFTELLKNTGWRKSIIAAVIISKVMDVIGGEMFNQYPIGENQELEEVTEGLKDFKQTALAEHHALLVQRTKIYRQIVGGDEFKTWVNYQVLHIANDLNAVLSPLVLMANRDKALMALRELVRAAYVIGVNMATEKPCEWVVHKNRRGDMYVPGQMIFRNPELMDDPRLSRKGAGDDFRVRLLIGPSITEKDFSSGKIMSRELQKAIVLLYERERQARGDK